MADHRGPAMEPFGLEVEAIGGLLGDPWGACCSAARSRIGSPDASSRASRPSSRTTSSAAAARPRPPRRRPPCASMRARRASAVRLSEASQIVPGRAVLARPLVRGGEPGRVTTRVGAAWGSRLPPHRGGEPVLGRRAPGGGRPIDGTEPRRRTDGAGLIRARREGQNREAQDASAHLNTPQKALQRWFRPVLNPCKPYKKLNFRAPLGAALPKVASNPPRKSGSKRPLGATLPHDGPPLLHDP